MGKKSKSQSKSDSKVSSSNGLPFLSGNASLDPTLTSLFAQSSGPVKAPAVKYNANAPANKSAKKAEKEDTAESDESPDSEDEVMEDASEGNDAETASSEEEEEKAEPQSRKRKRGPAEEDVEESYMRRIAKEEQKADEKRKAEQSKRQKPAKETSDESDKSDEEDEEDGGDKTTAPPVHESVSGNAKTSEVEKSNRTVFLGNVSTQAIKSKSAKKTLLRHLASFCSSLPESSGPHKVDSIRFRSVPFASGGGLPKRASFARREILDETTPSTNAYAVYTTIQAARKAPAALNGTVVLDRHIRVDSIAHPAEIDHKRCVFVGNLDFVDQEGTTEDENGKKKKVRAPADIEEGLWRTFNENTGAKDKKDKKSVEFVRVIRDRATRVGKGFAYVQFYDGNGVEAALLLNEKKFPPLLPRKLRVTRARKMAKKRDDDNKDSRKGDLAQKTLQGRANKLLGRAGAAKMKEAGKGGIAGNSMVFEGHRATEDGSRIKVKTKSRGSKGKPKNHGSKRAAAYRAAGGQKP
ncbi:Nucleolar protein 12 [Penicillium argentinense]|uniref:Nucleolar protein 12 n=1 Tax=Penicillium argentinense TaxID=1131581 RepID=A0A9W9EHV9_9EURO|nr:Nucleolar protein 12 [Penicillium argentinense]KAJ5082042.1 Nucleolar protein 12 [Penicillium argentinense]